MTFKDVFYLFRRKSGTRHQVESLLSHPWLACQFPERPFQQFSDTLEELTHRLKRDSRLELGIMLSFIPSY